MSNRPASTSAATGIPRRRTRRHFLSFVAATIGAGREARGGVRIAPETDVLIVAFSDGGERLGAERVLKVVKSDAEWRKQLSALAYQVARRGGTERAFSGAYWNLHDRGLFRCVCCDTALFSSDTKFDSGTGWPSFYDVIAKENVVANTSRLWLLTGSEVTCRRCDAHLGDVFDDGPRPTGLRYCIDSVSLRFVRRIGR